ncbi:PREDICTED: tumor necrosis factor receptor superfamily member 13C [Crocodylus porosus]|uniref:tumor necrosis factor receptor superfamily member 13C n=1 Tax=Crocodylus porosus TaxID=8502 RepID=UPI00093C3FCF|nr:PREDICTED: tumor necrosis factor receptor superfamily member 13C [Crocodylus porosus]
MPLDWTNKHADISSDCPQDLCFDKLIKQCLSCHLYGTSNADTRDLTSMAPTPTQLPPHPSGNMPSPVLVFGIPVLMGLVLVLASVWGFITWKMRRRRRKREKPNKESKENQDCVISFESQACTGPKHPEEDDLVLAMCPHLNGSLKTAGPTGRGETSKWKLAYQGGVGNEVIQLSALSPCNEEWDHGFPLPATELGATVLVTTKTIQNSYPNEERP